MKKALIFLAVTSFINIVIRVICRISLPFSEWYAMRVYPLIVGFWGRVTGIFPFAVVEILFYILISTAIVSIVFLIIKLIKGKRRRVRYLLRAGLAFSCAVSTLLVMFLFGCEINYQRNPFSYYSGLELTMYSRDDLRGAITEVIGELDLLVPQITTGADGGFVLDKTTFNKTARESMQRLGGIYPVLYTYYPNPKPVFSSRFIMSPLMICGIFSPFTIESLYNTDMPDSDKPFTALHELSHLNGFMREDEANFIAFLACRESMDLDFMYSGYIHALSYLLRAYDGDDYIQIYRTIPEQVRLQYALDTEYWQSFLNAPGGAAIAAVSSAVNDAYLKTQGQEDGVKSYGRVVDLLIADYLARNK
ncbi:MAG: DUF3810 domain-containing protein [Oscillospiraceae bacterium]|nr:DUF3810 domain-containing protein [Oscillospiraceae bacterium]